MKRIVIILLAVSLATIGCEQDDFPFSMEGPFEMPGGQQAATNLKDPLPAETTQEELNALVQELNGRKEAKPLDRGLVEALKGLAAGDNCTLTIPCERCSYMQKKKLITIQ